MIFLLADTAIVGSFTIYDIKMETCQSTLSLLQLLIIQAASCLDIVPRCNPTTVNLIDSNGANSRKSVPSMAMNLGTTCCSSKAAQPDCKQQLSSSSSIRRKADLT